MTKVKGLYIPGRTILKGRHHHHLDNSRGAKQVHDLVVGEGDGGHFADLHQAAALAQPHLPGEAVGFHVRHNPLRLDVEAQLTQPIAFQDHLHRLQHW